MSTSKTREVKGFIIKQIKTNKNWMRGSNCYYSDFVTIDFSDSYRIKLRRNYDGSNYTGEFKPKNIGLSSIRLWILIQLYVKRHIKNYKKNSEVNSIILGFDKLMDNNKQLKRDTNLNKVLED